MTLLKLDQRIRRDLEDLYKGGILTFIQNFKNCKITEAEQLSMDLFGTPNELSIHGLPGYYTGKRDAATVMVMLNPGSDVMSQNNPFVTEKTLNRILKELGKTNISSSADFVKIIKRGSDRYGNIDKDRLDNFDIKQAAFLKAWENSGVDIPNNFPDMIPRPSKKGKEERDKLLREVKQNVLMQKLQLELIPYASRKFKTINPNNYKHLFPYVETLFQEIFSKKRTYVIFCSDFFDKLFNAYSVDNGYSGTIDFGNKVAFEDKEGKQLFNKGDAFCTPIKITYNGESIYAVIAHTFPNQSLPNAYDKMQAYGKFCYDVYNDYKLQNNKP